MWSRVPFKVQTCWFPPQTPGQVIVRLKLLLESMNPFSDPVSLSVPHEATTVSFIVPVTFPSLPTGVIVIVTVPLSRLLLLNVPEYWVDEAPEGVDPLPQPPPPQPLMTKAVRIRQTAFTLQIIKIRLRKFK